ncbi:MAG: hypothetical protein K0U38_09780 [Epsilonproteobacteria bacterium]|nr:hypothetical protein [Campylobacterota bacterium]
MHTVLLYQTLRLMVRLPWYKNKFKVWIKEEDFKKTFHDTQLHILLWAVLIVFIVAELNLN